MPKRVFLLWMLLGAAFLLCACGQPSGGTAAPSPTPTQVQGTKKDLHLSYLYFSERGSYFKRVQGYEFRLEDGKPTACFYMANEEELYPVAVDQAWVDQLNGFITEYNMLAWNGFSGSSPGLLDGTQFDTEFTLTDGTNVKASGYGDFPEGYGGASKAIDAHFLQLLPQDMRDW